MERSRTRERTMGRSQNLVLGGASSQKNLLPAVDADASKQKEEKKDGDYGEAYTGVSFVDIESMLLNLALIAAREEMEPSYLRIISSQCARSHCI